MPEKTYFLITEDELEVLANHYVDKLYNISESWNKIDERTEERKREIKETAERYITIAEAIDELRQKEAKKEAKAE